MVVDFHEYIDEIHELSMLAFSSAKHEGHVNTPARNTMSLSVGHRYPIPVT